MKNNKETRIGHALLDANAVWSGGALGLGLFLHNPHMVLSALSMGLVGAAFICFRKDSELKQHGANDHGVSFGK